MLKKIIFLLFILIVIKISYKSFFKEKDIYINEVLKQEEIGMIERSVLEYVKNTKNTNDIYLEQRDYIENDNVYKITIKIKGYKLYDVYVDLNKKNNEGKYDNFVVLERE